MSKTMKFVHYFGLILFLGSIFTYTLISTLTKNASLENLVFARQIISSGTIFLTLPGMFLILVAGIIITLKDFHFLRHRWLNIKHAIIVIIILNTFIFILPAEREALELAKASLAQGKLLSEYTSAYMKESIAGALNVLLVVVSIIVAIWRFEKKPATNNASNF
jgi:hypothetical protein